MNQIAERSPGEEKPPLQCLQEEEKNRERFPQSGHQALTPHSVSTAAIGFGESVLPSSGMLSSFSDAKSQMKENKKGIISTKSKQEKKELSVLLFSLQDCWLPCLD